MIRLLDVDRRHPRAGTIVLRGLYLTGCVAGGLFLQLSVGAGVFVGAVEDAFSEGDFDQGGDGGDAGGDDDGVGFDAAVFSTTTILGPWAVAYLVQMKRSAVASDLLVLVCKGDRV